MSEEQEQAALLLERVINRLSGYEMAALERIVEGPEDYDPEEDEELEELEDAVSEAQDALDSAQDELDDAEEALAAYRRSKERETTPNEDDISTLTRLCTEYAEEFK